MSVNWGTELGGNKTAGILLVLIKILIGMSVFTALLALLLWVTSEYPAGNNESSTMSALMVMAVMLFGGIAHMFFLASIVFFSIWLHPYRGPIGTNCRSRARLHLLLHIFEVLQSPID